MRTCNHCGDTFPDFDVAHVCSKGQYAPKLPAPNLRKAAQDVIDAFYKFDQINGTLSTLRAKIKDLRAALAQPDDPKQRLLEIMRKNGLATGHGDTLKQVIDTLEVELTDRRDALCEWTRHGFGRTYDTACKSGYVRFVTRPDVWKFCPNCGKKIRFIEGDNNGTL